MEPQLLPFRLRELGPRLVQHKGRTATIPMLCTRAA
jgi:hypothetical protein